MNEEENQGTKVWVDSPLDTDVLLGKQRDAFNHIGNRSFRSLINANWERYNNAKGRCERTAIVVSIVKFLRDEREVRFLKKDPVKKRWFIVPNAVAREKVGHAIRDAINFRRHHERKMAQASASGQVTATTVGTHIVVYDHYHSDKDRQRKLLPQHNPHIPMVCTSLPAKPSLIIQDQRRTKPSPCYSKLDTQPTIIANQDTEDAAEMLGALKQSHSASLNKTIAHHTSPPTRLPSSTPKMKVKMARPSSSNSKTINMIHQAKKIPDNSSDKSDEGAMMIAFNIWASLGKHLKV